LENKTFNLGMQLKYLYVLKGGGLSGSCVLLHTLELHDGIIMSRFLPAKASFLCI
jgi:hypothetical protein